jgi:hypothetical protein
VELPGEFDAVRGAHYGVSVLEERQAAVSDRFAGWATDDGAEADGETIMRRGESGEHHRGKRLQTQSGSACDVHALVSDTVTKS